MAKVYVNKGYNSYYSLHDYILNRPPSTISGTWDYEVPLNIVKYTYIVPHILPEPPVRKKLEDYM